MKFLDQWKTRRFFIHTDRFKKKCIRYFREAERYSSKFPDCKRFRGLSLVDDDNGILIDIRRDDRSSKEVEEVKDGDK